MAFTPSVIYYDDYISKKVLYRFQAYPDITSKNVYSVYTDGYDLDEGHTLPEKQGYIFLGWSQYINGNSEIISKDAVFNDLTYGFDLSADGTYHIYAVWKALPPTITFNANSGTFLTNGEAQTIYNSTKLTGSTALSSIVETPTKPGYVFQGWSTTSTGAVQYTQTSKPTISSDTTLYAIYEPDTTKVLLEKGAVDIIVDKIKNAKSGPTISASGDTLTITN